jgi:hypothetical protein
MDGHAHQGGSLSSWKLRLRGCGSQLGACRADVAGRRYVAGETVWIAVLGGLGGTVRSRIGANSSTLGSLFASRIMVQESQEWQRGVLENGRE